MQIYDRIDALARAAEPGLIELRHRLHAAPELSNRESTTAAAIVEHLRRVGIEDIRTGIAGHGVVGVLHGELPGERVAALRADMDALPVREASGVPFASTVVDEDYPGGPFPVAHACGHDCHMAAVLTAATVLSQVRGQLPGRVAFLFQPAEEGPPVDEQGGAQAMLDAGALADPRPTMVFGMHVGPLPVGVVGYAAGSMYAASCLVQVVVHGTQVHGSTPWMGADPMPAAAGIVLGSAQLYRQVPATSAVTVSFGHLEDVGRFNIIGERVTLWGTIRCVDAADMSTIQERLRRLAEGQASSFGCTAQVEYLQAVPPVVNTPAWLDAVLPTVRRVVGEDRAVPIPPTLGYDDVSVFIDECGGAYLLYGVQDTVIQGAQLAPAPGGRGLAPNHHPAFYADDASLVDSVRIHAHVALDHLLGVAVTDQ